MSVGMQGYGWLSALGWKTAGSGGFAVARYAAEGPIAWAQHANDSVARQFFADPNAERNQMIFFALVSVLTIIPVVPSRGRLTRPKRRKGLRRARESWTFRPWTSVRGQFE